MTSRQKVAAVHETVPQADSREAAEDGASPIRVAQGTPADEAADPTAVEAIENVSQSRSTPRTRARKSSFGKFKDNPLFCKKSPANNGAWKVEIAMPGATEPLIATITDDDHRSPNEVPVIPSGDAGVSGADQAISMATASSKLSQLGGANLTLREGLTAPAAQPGVAEEDDSESDWQKVSVPADVEPATESDDAEARESTPAGAKELAVEERKHMESSLGWGHMFGAFVAGAHGRDKLQPAEKGGGEAYTSTASEPHSGHKSTTVVQPKPDLGPGSSADVASEHIYPFQDSEVDRTSDLALGKMGRKELSAEEWSDADYGEADPGAGYKDDSEIEKNILDEQMEIRGSQAGTPDGDTEIFDVETEAEMFESDDTVPGSQSRNREGHSGHTNEPSLLSGIGRGRLSNGAPDDGRSFEEDWNADGSRNKLLTFQEKQRRKPQRAAAGRAGHGGPSESRLEPRGGPSSESDKYHPLVAAAMGAGNLRVPQAAPSERATENGRSEWSYDSRAAVLRTLGAAAQLHLGNGSVGEGEEPGWAENRREGKERAVLRYRDMSAASDREERDSQLGTVMDIGIFGRQLGRMELQQSRLLDMMQVRSARSLLGPSPPTSSLWPFTCIGAA